MGTEMLRCAQHDIPGVKAHYKQATRKEHATWLR